MVMFSKRGAGFTIVELLIVIVVIGILAAIVIVAYRGVQQRANNTATASAVNQAIKSIMQYQAEKSASPQADGSTYCLTKDNSCTDYSGIPAIARSNSGLMTDVAPYGGLPDKVRAGTKYFGISYKYFAGYTLNGAPNPLLIIFWLQGLDQDCAAVTGSMVSVGDAVPVLNFTQARNDKPDSGDGQTRCYLMFSALP